MLRVDFAKSLNTTWPKNETWRKKRKELNYRGKTSFIHCDKKLQAVIFLTNSQVAKCLIKVLPMFISKIFEIPPNPLNQQASSHEPTLASCSSGLPPPIQLPNVFHHQCAPRPTIPQPQIAPLSSANLSELPMIHQHPVNYPTPVNTISQQNYPCPQPDMFLIYLLGMCPKQTSICFGCRNSLKPGGVIGTPPADLVIVSKMVRTWTHEGQQQSRHANVYFHCVPTCVRQKQPYFQPCHTFIASQIVALLRDEHWQYLNQTFGNLAIR